MARRLFAVLLCCLLQPHATAQEGVPRPDRIDAALDLIETEYLHHVERDELEARALRTLLVDLDPYSRYMNAEEWAIYESSFTGSFGGIGITLAIDDELRLPKVGMLMIGSSAGAAGVRRGDHIAKIDGSTLEGMPLDEILPLLRGTPGTTVELSIRRGGAPALVPLKVQRKRIEDPSVRGVRRDAKGKPEFMLDEMLGIGYIRILGFGDDTVALVESALVQLTKRKMHGLVLDLRGCAGGKMQAAVATADAFLDRGRIVSVVSRTESETIDAQPGVMTSVPVAMLVNAETASSAEILAAALADNGRVTVIGQRTFGKGRVQRKLALPDGLGGVVLTTGTFQRPSGTTFDRHDAKDAAQAGIAPDEGMEVLLDENELAAWTDEMGRLDGPFVLEPEEQVSRVPDRVLARGVDVLAALIATD